MGVVCQFSPNQGRPTLKDFIPIPEVYPAGRLDTDSEGLLLLTNDGPLQARISDPAHQMEKVYWAQVEGNISNDALSTLSRGVMLADGVTRPAEARLLEPAPEVWERHPPIRVRASIPTSWLELKIREGRNRQVRRMTAAVGFPTLRLIRYAIGPFDLRELRPGEWKDVKIELV
jgi:23S rRNA pseudouridine2457 synthase